MKFNIVNETNKLKAVILGTAEGFYQGPKINEGMRRYYGKTNGPTADRLASEYDQIKKKLQNYGVTVYQPQPSQAIPQQLAPRDIGFVVDDTFVFSSMTCESRKNEALAIQHIINQFAGNVLHTPEEVHLEGGNIVIDKGTLFVGIGIRTTPNAVDFLKTKFGTKYKIIPIHIHDHEEVIHLDAVFNILDDGFVVAYTKCLSPLPKELITYTILEVTKKERDLGGCNFLSIDHKTKLFRAGLTDLTAKLKSLGYTIEEVPWTETKKTGTTGPRCAVLPLVRVSN